MKINLLIVEDNQQLIDNWTEKLELYAVEDSPLYEISHSFVKTLREAKQTIENTKFDTAVIDIRLAEEGTQTFNGNEVLEQLSHNSLTVCAVHTGEPGTEIIEEHLKDFIKVFRKGDGEIEDILTWLDSKSEMISAIQTMEDSFKKSMSKAFTHSIWPRWSYWLNGEHNPEFASKALTRHMATHLHASFLNEAEAVHPEEYYFIPPLQNRLDTGDIIFRDDNYYMLVTPRCDLAREQNLTFQLVKLTDKKAEWEALHLKKANGSKKDKEKATKDIRNIVNHGDRSPKLHFIPQFKLSSGEELGPFHAQFNYMTCIETKEDCRNQLTSQRVATLSNEFVPSLVERLGAYFSRIGTPDYSHPE